MELLETRQTYAKHRAGVSVGIERRMEFLEPADRKLLELTVKGKLTRREAGMLVGMSCGTVTRRVRRLIERLNDPLIVALVERGQLLPELHREVGLMHFLRGTPLKRVARDLGLSMHAARGMVQYVRLWHE